MYWKNINYLFLDFCSEYQMVLTKFIHPNLLEIYSILSVLLIYTATMAVKAICQYFSRVCGCDLYPCSCCIKNSF